MFVLNNFQRSERQKRNFSSMQSPKFSPLCLIEMFLLGTKAKTSLLKVEDELMYFSIPFRSETKEMFFGTMTMKRIKWVKHNTHTKNTLFCISFPSVRWTSVLAPLRVVWACKRHPQRQYLFLNVYTNCECRKNYK